MLWGILLTLKKPLLNEGFLKPSTIPYLDGRLIHLDALRGLIMMLMAIDHASYFIAKVHHSEFWGIALPHYLSIVPFLTRWITHLCAPGFFLLMGSGMILFATSRQKAGWNENKIIRFFVTRGLFLIILQLLIENPAWLLGTIGNGVKAMQPPGGGGEVMLHFGVLYGLGSNMIIFAFLMRANSAIIAFLSISSVLITQWLIPGTSEANILYSPLLRLVLIPGHTGLWQSFYPSIPWFGITGLGIIFGKLMLSSQDRLFRNIRTVGVIFLILFVLIRLIGGFGNFHSWNNGLISFLNVTKYPPSLSYVLLTLGIILLILYLLSKTGRALTSIGKPLLIFGRTALFFYISHLYLYATIGFAFPNGTSYQLMYLLWLTGLLILYPICLWYGKFKQKKAIDSLWKLF